MNRSSPVWALFFLGLASSVAFAHQGSTAYLTLRIDRGQVLGRWEIPITDLGLTLGLKQDAEHPVSLNQQELSNRFGEVKEVTLAHLRLKLDEVPGVLQVTNPTPVVQRFADGLSLVLDFAVTNALATNRLEVEYRFRFAEDPLEQAFMQLECGGVTQTAIFTPQATTHLFDLHFRQRGSEFWAFSWHGVHHIWIGYDHTLFLLALLLPAVLRREEGKWRPVSDVKPAVLNVLKVVTAFTVAHSITLSLAALHVIQLPSRYVEAAIALSVFFAALNNVRHVFPGPAWIIAFAFGLVHGFGFASVLADLGLPQNELVVALIGFNVGVELGQLAVVIVFLPAAFALRRSAFYSRWILKFGSSLIALIALWWMCERLFNLSRFFS